MKRLLYIFVLTLVVLGCTKDPLESKLKELDKMLSNRAVYAQKLEHRADSIRLEMGKTENDSLRWEYADTLFNMYRFFQVDSSMKYLKIMEKCAGEDPTRQFLCSFCQVEIDVSLRKYKDAEDILTSMDTLQMNNQLKSQYYSSLLLLYATEVRDVALPEDMRFSNDSTRDEMRNRLIASLKTSSFEYIRRNAVRDYKQGRYEESIRSLEELVENSKSLQEKSNAAWSLSNAYWNAGDKKNQMIWLAQGAIYDIQIPVREFLSLYELANLVYEDHQLVRASRYNQIVLEEALLCNFNARLYSSASSQLNIVRAVEYEQRRQRIISVLVILLLSALTITIAALLRHSRSQARNIRVGAKKLEKVNNRLEEANRIKEGYVFQYMNLSAKYLGLVEDYRHSLRVTLKEDGEEALKQMLREQSVTRDNYNEFYRIFDETFLGVFPDFVEDVNSLLREEARFSLSNKKELSTGLRILAVIRLGITDSGKIAQFLNCAPTSVYTHRSKIKKQALCPPEEFEKRLCQI